MLQQLLLLGAYEYLSRRYLYIVHIYIVYEQTDKATPLPQHGGSHYLYSHPNSSLSYTHFVTLIKADSTKQKRIHYPTGRTYGRTDGRMYVQTTDATIVNMCAHLLFVGLRQPCSCIHSILFSRLPAPKTKFGSFVNLPTDCIWP